MSFQMTEDQALALHLIESGATVPTELETRLALALRRCISERDELARRLEEARGLLADTLNTVATEYSSCVCLKGWEAGDCCLCKSYAFLSPASAECHCDMRTRVVGDGCSVCNPELAAEIAADNAASAEGGGE